MSIGKNQKKMTKYFVTGIGTGVGKTIVSAALTHHLEAEYWKPIQCGDEEGKDKDFLLKSGIDPERIYDEKYFLQAPQSPHFAADLEGVKIELNDFELPEFKSQNVVIEGAGGLLVPLNNKNEYVVDFASRFDASILLVIRHYLGSINHSLLSIEWLKQKGLKVKGIIISGPRHEASESVILNQGFPLVGHLGEVMKYDRDTLNKNFEWYG